MEQLGSDEMHFRSLSDDYKLQCEEWRRKYETLQQKLNERNVMIEKIEKEVERVKMAFETKQQELIQAHKSEVLSMEQKYQVDQQNALFYITEKEALLQRMKDQQKWNQKLQRQKDQLEKELKFVLTELEKERTKSSQKLSQLKKLLIE
jgi:DNA repair ATPase RecN